MGLNFIDQFCCTYTTGPNPRGVAIGDVNGDSKLDIVTANYNVTGTVSVLLNQGSNNGIALSSLVFYSVETFPTVVTLSDVNGDTKLDIITINNAGTISVLINQGGGIFSTPTNYAVGTILWDIALGDVNNDNKIDIVTVDYNNHPGTVSVLLNIGNGSFASPIKYATTYAINGLALGDINGDGNLDIVVSDFDEEPSTISVLFNQGNGIFTTPPSAYTIDNYFGMGIAIGDINNDGKSDVIIATGFIVVLLNQGGGTLSNPYTVGNGSEIVVLGDVNGDNKLDILTTNSDTSNISVLLNQGNGIFATQVTYIIYCDSSDIALGDMNGDGKLDIVATVGQNNVIVLLNQGSGTFLSIDYPSYAVDYGPQGVAIGDVNSDTKLDIVTAGQSGNISVLLNIGNGAFSRQISYVAGSFFPQGVTIGDVNGDGKLDVISANVETISVFINKGNGTFEPQVQYARNGGQVSSVALGDINGDSKVDIVTDSVSLLLGNGDGTFSPATLVFSNPCGLGMNGVALGDINGDGNLDIVAATCNVITILGYGNGTFAAPTTYIQPEVTVVALGDMNGDGNLDIVAAGTDVFVLFNQGNGTFAAQTICGVGFPQGLALGDIDGDCNLDIVLPGGGASVLLNQGNGTFSAPVSYAVGCGPVGIALGDVNGDSKLDIVTADYGSSDAYVLINNSTYTTTPTTTITHSTSSSTTIVPITISSTTTMIPTTTTTSTSSTTSTTSTSTPTTSSFTTSTSISILTHTTTLTSTISTLTSSTTTNSVTAIASMFTTTETTPALTTSTTPIAINTSSIVISTNVTTNSSILLSTTIPILSTKSTPILTESDHSSSSSSNGVLIGAVVGGVALLALVLGYIIYKKTHPTGVVKPNIIDHHETFDIQNIIHSSASGTGPSDQWDPATYSGVDAGWDRGVYYLAREGSQAYSVPTIGGGTSYGSSRDVIQESTPYAASPMYHFASSSLDDNSYGWGPSEYEAQSHAHYDNSNTATYDFAHSSNDYV